MYPRYCYCYVTGFTQVNILVTQTKYRRKDGICSRFNSHFNGCIRSRGLHGRRLLSIRAKANTAVRNKLTQVHKSCLSTRIGSLDTFTTHRT